MFDFPAIKKFLARSDFAMVYDALWAVTAAYAKPLFCNLLGCPESVLRHAEAKDDFAGGHPDPNLTYARELVDEMWDDKKAADFAAASDGDGDRNMILGRKFFVTPSDSVAMIAANAQACSRGSLLCGFAAWSSLGSACCIIDRFSCNDRRRRAGVPLLAACALALQLSHARERCALNGISG